MASHLSRFLWIVAVAATALGGCAASGPYIYQPGEFDRKNKNFGKEPLNIDSVTICYNKMATTPEIVAKMASSECAKFNKRAVFSRQSFVQCSLVAPVAAVYTCVGDQEEKKEQKK